MSFKNSKNTGAEIAAAQAVHEALEPLDADARLRTINYIVNLLDIDISAKPRSLKIPENIGETQQTSGLRSDSKTEDKFRTFAEFHNAANPIKHPASVLVATYWMQIYEGHESVESQAVNNILKDIGRKVTNITSAYTLLMKHNPAKHKPALIVQVQKRGKSHQARKKYSVTDAGKTRVKEMLNVGGQDE